MSALRLGAALAAGLALAACGGGSAPEKAAAATPPASAPQTPPPAPAKPAAEEDIPPAGATTPKGIPRDALAFRNQLIRIWRFYFALAEPPSIGFAQIHQESRWKPLAASKFASGLAQFTPGTARDYAGKLPPEIQAKCGTTAGCPTEPSWALHALSLYDYNLLKLYPWAATHDDRWRLALAAYNGGGGWITKERVKAGGSTKWVDIADACMRSEASCKENRHYPVVILEQWWPLYKGWLKM